MVNIMLKKLTMVCSLCIAALLMAPASQAAKPEGVGKDKTKHQHKAAKHNKSANSGNTESYDDAKIYGFTRNEADIIRDYYGDHYGYDARTYKSLPKGLQKKLARGGTLPPGWQRKLQQGDVLDHELRALSEPIPESLRRRLPDYDRARYELIRIKDQIVRVARGEGTIIDILSLTDLFLNR